MALPRTLPRTTSRRTVLALALTSLLCAACAGRVPGRIAQPLANPALVAQPFPLRLQVDLPVDERPPQELSGAAPETTFFLFLLFYLHISERGNLITSPIELGPSPLVDLHQMTMDALTRSRVFREVGATVPGAELRLRARVHHLFAARFVGSSFSLAASRDSADVRSSKAQFAPFGNVVVSYELVDQRGGKSEVIWRDTVAGMSVGPPASPKYGALPGIAASAAASLVIRLSRALHLCVERLAMRERAEAPPVDVQDGFRFMVQRTGPARTEVELLTIEHPSGRIAQRRVVAADSLPPGRPGDWLLSRRLPSGEAVTGARYAAMAKKLARVFDLRRVDDAYYLHFFGLRGRKPPAAPAPPSTPPPPPPVQ